MKSVKDARTTDELTDELFRAVEAHQGHFSFSDGGEPPSTPRAEFFAKVRFRLKHGEAAVKKMRAFLKKYGEL